MAVNTQKLLPASKSSALAVRTSKIKVGGGQLAKSSGGGLSKEILQMKVKVLKLQGEFDKNKKLNQKEQETKRKNEEKEKRSKREKKLEKKDGKGFELPNVVSRLPGGSIVDAIKRYIGFTFLGWLVGKYDVLMPQLEKFMSVAKPVFEGLVFTTEAILKGVYGFVEAGYKAYDSVSATIKQIGGEDAEKTFHDFSSHLNKLLNGTLMAAMLIASTSPGGKPGKIPGGKPGRGGGYAKPNQRLQSYLGRNDQTKLIERRYGNDAARMYEARRAQGGSHSRALADVRGRFQPTSSPLGSLGGTNQGSGVFNRGLAKAPQRAATKMFGKAAGKTVSKLGGRIPIVGPLIDFGIRTLIYKEPLGKAAAGAVGMGVGQALGGWLGGAIGGIVGSVVPFVGTMLVGAAGATIGSLIGGVIGDMLGAALYDFVAGSGDKKKPQGKSRGGTVSSSNKKPRRRVATQITRERILPQNTSPGKDIGGRKKIEEFYGKEKVTESTGKLFEKEETRGQLVVEELEKISKNVKKLPLDWVASIGGAFIDMTMGQKPSKNLSADVGKSFGVFIENIINNEVALTTDQITKSLTGMANGGVVSEAQQVRGQISKKVASDIENQLQSIFDSAYSIASDNIKRTMVSESEGTGTPPSGPGVTGSPDYTDITKISMGGFSPEDIDVLGRMVAAEAGNQSKHGKAGVLSVILNRYRLAKAGNPGYMPSGKNKNTVTLKDILYDSGQFSPITDGRFDKTSSAAGKNALADAIAGGGNDPQKFKKILMEQSGFDEKDAETIVRATAFSNPKTRRSKPFATPEVSLGDHSFQESPYARIGSFPGAIDASVRREISRVEALSEGFRTGLRTGPAGRIGVGEEYHIDAKIHSSLSPRDRVAMVDAMAQAYAAEGRVMFFSGSGTGTYGARWNVNASLKEKMDLLKSQIDSHSHSTFMRKEGFLPFDYYSIKTGAKNAYDTSAVGANIMAPKIRGGTYEYGEGGGYGRFLYLRDKNGKLLFMTGHGDKGMPSPKQLGKRFKIDELEETSYTSGASKGDYDIIIPLDHVPANLANKIPDKRGGNTFKAARQTGADGREREYTDKIAAYVSQKLSKQGYRVKIVRPEDYGNYEDYDKFIMNQSKMGTAVLPFHLDADPRRGGVGFLARIRKGDFDDEKLAVAVSPVLKKYAQIFGEGQRFGGIDSAQNATIDRAAASPAALLELGSLVSLEKRFGKDFTNHPDYKKFLDELSGAISQSVAKKQPAIKKGQKAVLNNKPVEWDGKNWTPIKSVSQIEGLSSGERKMVQGSRDMAARPWYDKFGWFGGAAALKNKKKSSSISAVGRQGGGTVLSSSQPQSSYSSLNKSGTLKEDTSDQQVIVMYQREIVMS